jgi:hypothetical protein
MADKKEPTPVVTSQPAEEEMSEAEIDRNLNGTFPASDPPSWTLGTDHRVDSEKRSGGDKEETD